MRRSELKEVECLLAGLSQQPGRSGAQPDPGDAGGAGSSADKAGTAWYCQTGWVRRARSDGIRQESVVKLRKRGTGSNLADMGRDAVHDRPAWVVDSVAGLACR